MKRIELLAPAKDYDQGYSALLCGADAIYVGAPRFGARAAAAVPIPDIEKLCREAHIFGAKVYVAMNTLLWDSELEEAQRTAQRVYEAGADALIIQDMSFMRMDLPPIDLHASTQTFNMTTEGARFFAKAGFSRIVTERALTLDEIRAMAECGMETEAFIHGAICVGYSGRCYMSRTTSRRSGNRGECSQSCRLPYNLLDKDMRPIIKDKHLLSLRDMDLTSHLEQLIDAGATSLKIEGRLKDMAYVRSTVSWYRNQIDRIIARRPDLVRSSDGISDVGFEADPAKTFSRGTTSYFIDGARNGVASMDTPKSYGEYIGRVAMVKDKYFTLDTAAGLHSGDGICFKERSGALCGTNVNEVRGKEVHPNRMDGITPGTSLFRNYDRLYVQSAENSRPVRTMDTTASVEISANEASLTLRCGAAEASARIEGDFEEAKNPGKAEESIKTQIRKTGDTAYRITEMTIGCDTPRFVPISVLNELRRKATSELDNSRLEVHIRPLRVKEDTEARYPKVSLSAEDNVTNALSERFYRGHGVTSIEKGLDLSENMEGQRVMQTRYCIRRELDMCLKENPQNKGTLYIENGLHLYELKFDCAQCRMDIIYKGIREKISKR